jgi:hypothetical protein
MPAQCAMAVYRGGDQRCVSKDAYNAFANAESLTLAVNISNIAHLEQNTSVFVTGLSHS